MQESGDGWVITTWAPAPPRTSLKNTAVAPPTSQWIPGEWWVPPRPRHRGVPPPTCSAFTLLFILRCWPHGTIPGPPSQRVS